MQNKVLLNLLKKWIYIKSLESLTVAFLTYSFFNLFITVEYALICSSMAFLIHLRMNDVFSLSLNHVVRYLNLMYPDLQYSTQLLIQDVNRFGDLQNVQYRKIEKVLSNMSVRLPFKWESSLFYTLTSVLILLLPNEKQMNKSIVVEGLKTINKLAIIEKKMQIKPPVYTKQKPFFSTDLNESIPEYSKVSWKIITNKRVLSAYVQLYGGEKLTLHTKDSAHYESKFITIKKSMFYNTIVIGVDSSRIESPLKKITVIRDEPPKISLSIKEHYQKLDMIEKPVFRFNTELVDDYGVVDATLVATVSKGKGESVKFREKEIHLKIKKTPFQTIPYEFSFKKFSITPGDEIYFYIQARDNHPVRKQISRSETYFIAIEDTSSESFTFSGGLTVNQMPAYFRSQRQIIIDTEKLIKKQENISNEEFLKEGNEIGYDQKVLRLKYGKFLGDEFESEMSIEAFGDEHSEGDGHDHNISQSGAAEVAKILTPFVHDHDNAEQSTYFEPKIKAKLKAALQSMWSSELNLRIGTPKQALPFQYKALKLIKEVREDSRIYVQRIGFEPPPINEAEQRLKGDKDEIKPLNYAYKNNKQTENRIETFIHWLEIGSYNLTPKYLNDVIQEVANHFLEKSVNYSKALVLLKKIERKTHLSQKEKKLLQASLYEILKDRNKLNNSIYPKTDLRSLYLKEVGGVL